MIPGMTQTPAALTPDALLMHHDTGQLWPGPQAALIDQGLPGAYRLALQVRALRLARGEQPRGFKIGFTNRGIWARYNVFAPIWGTVYDTGLHHADPDGLADVPLTATCQPRIEPEAVFGLRHDVRPGSGLAELFDAIEWVAPGFEVVQSHLPGWSFEAADTVADGALHARLLVGLPTPVRSWAADAGALQAGLAACRVRLLRNGEPVDEGSGQAVLDDPLSALHHFVQALAGQPDAPALKAGDVITTGTWTDAWPIAPGQTWQADFDAPLGRLTARFTA